MLLTWINFRPAPGRVDTGRARLATALLGALLIGMPAHATAEACTDCHDGKNHGLATGHRFEATACTACHGGDGTADEQAVAHAGMEPYPGNLDNAARACGTCHAAQVEAVRAGTMHTGHGMVATTRAVLEPARGDWGPHDLQSLGHGPADSLLRKLCASCHLGQPKRRRALDAVRDRGGGCLACHLNAYPQSGHPALTRRVEDGRCFGCHSRSGRISLSYAGLAEAGDAVRADPDATLLGLTDGRLLEPLPADVHHRAGMACTDCHTGAGLMGMVEGVDIACADCHSAAARDDALDGPRTRQETPLTGLEPRGDALLLHPRLGGPPLTVPQVADDHMPLAAEHRRLSCQACHSQWAPQCYGCHVEYRPGEPQWDHVEAALTPGAWRERRWAIHNELPTLGVRTDGSIHPVVPGMIMTVEHPDWERARFVRRYAPLSPHTTGRARACVDCHRSPQALGLGSGRLRSAPERTSFEPAAPILGDGLPSDAWTSLDGSGPSAPPGAPARPFDAAELRRILAAPLDDE